MFSKALVALAAASIVGQAAASPHKHGLQHAHQKRALVTEMVTVTDWVTVTVTGDDTNTKSKVFYTHSRKVKTTSSSESSTTSTSASPESSTVSAAVEVSASSAPEQSNPPAVEDVPSSTSISTTPEVVNTPAPTSEAPAPEAPAPSSTVEAVPTSAAVDTGNGNTGDDTGSGNGGTTTGTAKRGLAYNNPALLQSFLNSGTKVSWAYNWGQYDDSGTDLEFCPMLWGLKLNFAETWPANAQKAIDGGSRCLLSFNEPDLPEQANLSPSVAAAKHIELMNPFSGKALIGSPAITNSGADGQGISYLKQFFDACDGKCAVDFVNIHIYGVDTNTFLSHLRNVHSAFNKPVWITEFAFGGTDDQINAQLETVIDQIENNATYSFVERYSYFMVSDGFLVKGNSLSTYGNTFAYGA